METLKPLMGERRKQQIDKTTASYDKTIINRRNNSRQKLFYENLAWAKSEIKSGRSLRSVAKELTVNHETLRQRLMKPVKYRFTAYHASKKVIDSQITTAVTVDSPMNRPSINGYISAPDGSEYKVTKILPSTYGDYTVEVVKI
jgi:hypothetical protein